MQSEIVQNQEKPKKTQRTLGGLRQDKRRFWAPRLGTIQLGALFPPSGARTVHTKMTRVQKMIVHKRRKAKLTLRLDPIEMDKVRRTAKSEGISLAQAGWGFLKSGMAGEEGKEYRGMLEPVIASILTQHMAARDNRLALLLVRNYLVAEQTRGLVTYIASRQPDMTPDILNDILDHTFQEAKKKLPRRSPELEELIKEVKSWVIEEERAPWKNGKGKP